MCNDSTVFVVVTDEAYAYLYKAKRTVQDLRTRGMWLGDIVMINVRVTPINTIFLDFYNVWEKKFPQI